MSRFFRILICLAGWLAGSGSALAAVAGPGTSPADPLHALHLLELPFILRVQAVEGLGPLMKFLSALGPIEFGRLVVAGLFFGWNPRLGVRVAVLLLATLWFRELLAMALQSPRPYWLHPGIQTFGDLSLSRATFGFPSGHVLAGTALWVFLAAEVKRPWMWIVTVTVCLAIGVSRVYLGVHFVSDVLLGLTLGTVAVPAFRRLEPAVEAWLIEPPSRPAAIGFILATGAGMVLLGAFVRTAFTAGRVPSAWLPMAEQAHSLAGYANSGGAFFGMGLGLVLLRPFPLATGPLWRRLARIGIAGGVAYLLVSPALRLVLKAVDPAWPETARVGITFTTYALAAAFGWGFLPWAFRRVGLEAPPNTPEG